MNPTTRNLPLFHDTAAVKWAIIGWAVVAAGVAAWNGHTLFLMMAARQPEQYSLFGHATFLGLLGVPLTMFRQFPSLDAKVVVAGILLVLYGAMMFVLQQAIMVLQT